MELVQTRGIPMDSPIMDTTARWTPPPIGPSDKAHLWLAHTLRGVDTSAGVPRIYDMIGSVDLIPTTPTLNDTGFVDSYPDVYFLQKTGYGKLNGTLPSADNGSGQTWFINCDTRMSPRTNQAVLAGCGAVSIQAGVVKIGSTTLGNVRTNGPSTVVLTFNSGTVTAFIDGVKSTATATITQTSTPTVAFGGYQAQAYEEKYKCMGMWTRVLTDNEISTIHTDILAIPR